jgi:hypothetical protein
LKQALYHILGNGITIKKAADNLHCTPGLMKEIHKDYLNKAAGTLKPKPGAYSEYIVVDEFLLHKGHRYCTMVLDGITGALLYLEPGKGKRQLKHFFKFVGPDFMKHVKACGMDMNCSFNAAIKQYCPHIAVVYDYFHLISWFNTKVLAPLRQAIYRSLKKEAEDYWLSGDHETSRLILENAGKVFDSRFLLPSNYKTLAAKDAANKAYGGELTQIEVTSGIWSMIAGDGDGNGQIDNNDKNDIWLQESNSLGYFSGDYNMNYQTNIDDIIIIWNPNSGKGGLIP